ncbi:NUDIX hydrolase [Candidatus Micrarchaeota archaeon]|nr:NUDIX hydrolase [Candidatus Micrarchaeota archaeon]
MSKPPFPTPSALACGLLRDGERFLFLKQKDGQGIEHIGFPCVFVFRGEDAVKKLSEAFLEQTGIDGHVREVLLEARHNAGSRRKKRFIACLGFLVSAKSANAAPGKGFTGFVWLSLKDAKTRKLLRFAEWILSGR